MISELMSILGFAQRSTVAASSKRSEANKLNAEFEKTMNSNVLWLQTEQIYLRHRVEALPEEPEEARELLAQIDTTIDMLLTEIGVGLETASNSRSTIASASNFATLSQWDELIGILHQQKNAAELQFERSRLTLGQFHRILDNAVE